MSKSRVSVYVFEGSAYYGRPGVKFAVSRVSEDFQPYRNPESKDWPKIERWLLDHGYRRLCTVGRKHEGAQQRQWWGLIDVFGQPAMDENGIYVPMSIDEIKQRFEAHKQRQADTAHRQDIAQQKGLSLRNQIIAAMSTAPAAAQAALLHSEEFQAGLNALDPEFEHRFIADQHVQGIIVWGLDAMIRFATSKLEQPTAEQVWGDPEPEPEVQFFGFKHGKLQYWVVDRKVDAAEFIAKQGYAGKASMRTIDPGQTFCGKTMPNWAAYIVYCASV